MELGLDTMNYPGPAHLRKRHQYGYQRKASEKNQNTFYRQDTWKQEGYISLPSEFERINTTL
jgi:hypothetical protein